MHRRNSRVLQQSGNPGFLDKSRGGGFVVGKRNESFIEFQNYGRLVFGITLNATVSFTGAESLAELRRNFF